MNIKELAEQAGVREALLLRHYYGDANALTDAEQERLNQLKRFAELVAAAEREACAKLCDGWSKRNDDVGAFIGRAIRARGDISTKSQNVNTSAERVHESDKSIHDLRKAAEMALAGLKQSIGLHIRNDEELAPIIESLEAALAQPEQDHGFDRTASHMAGEYVDTTPPSKPWVSLTDEVIANLYHASSYNPKEYDGGANNFARSIEAASKELNT